VPAPRRRLAKRAKPPHEKGGGLGDNDVVRRREWEQYQRDMERRVSGLEGELKALRTEHDTDMENWEREQRERRRWTVGQIVAVAGATIALAALWLQALSLHH